MDGDSLRLHPATFKTPALPAKVPTDKHQQQSSPPRIASNSEGESAEDDLAGSSNSPSPSPPLPAGRPAPTRTDEPPQQPTGRRSKAAGTGKDGVKEKRKRSRVTPEQLVHLERFFAADRSPTAARRKEIGDYLGMHERQTQVWFQNRRAKAKLIKTKKQGRTHFGDGLDPATLPLVLDSELQDVINENEPVTLIPCSELAIGTWRRIATAVNKHDLVTYISEAKACLTWFIHSSGFGFKMEIPFDAIVDTSFASPSPGVGLAYVNLARPPVFYRESTPAIGAEGALFREWKRCADWTEGAQASKVLRHELTGPAAQLAHILRNFNPRAASDIPLQPTPYYPGSNASANTPPARSEQPREDYFGQPRTSRAYASPAVGVSAARALSPVEVVRTPSLYNGGGTSHPSTPATGSAMYASAAEYSDHDLSPQRHSFLLTAPPELSPALPAGYARRSFAYVEVNTRPMIPSYQYMPPPPAPVSAAQSPYHTPSPPQLTTSPFQTTPPYQTTPPFQPASSPQAQPHWSDPVGGGMPALLDSGVHVLRSPPQPVCVPHIMRYHQSSESLNLHYNAEGDR